MRRVVVLLAIIALMAAPAAVLAQEEFTAELDTDQEVPAPDVPADYEGRGSGSATISEDESEISFELSFENLTGPATMAHIHYGAQGEAGGILFWLSEMGQEASSPLSGTLTEADFTAVDGGPQTYAEALEAIRAGNTYFNVHTDQNPPGEIRGQLMAVAPPDDDDDEVSPPPTSTLPAEGAAPAGPAPLATIVLLMFGAAIVVLGLRRFYVQRT